MLGGRDPTAAARGPARQQVVAAPRRDVACEDMRLAAVGQPVIPEAVFAALGQVRLDLRVLAFSLARFACAASPARSGHTQDTNAIRLPSGNHFIAAAPVARFVTRVASPPSGGIR